MKSAEYDRSSGHRRVATAVSSDTIGGEKEDLQLPTPMASSVDAASESNHDNPLKQDTSMGNKQRTRRSSKYDACKDVETEKNRSFSGETIVASESQSSILQNGITALNLPWSVTSLHPDGDGKENEADMIMNTMDKPASLDIQHDQNKSERAGGRSARMAENARIWEVRQQAAKGKATRRSSRASMLGKAGETVSDLKLDLLGKRSRDMVEKGKGRLDGLKRRATLRPSSMAGPVVKEPSFEGPTTKRRRLSEGDVVKKHEVSFATAAVEKKHGSTNRRRKRWLTSGLYTGQTRSFDGRFKESKNKRRAIADPSVKENKTLPLPMFAGERLMQDGRDFKLPYDVFSPLPPGQPKPDEWRKTNKNVFVGDTAEAWRHSKRKEHSTCMCTPESGCNEDCMNRFMFYECDDRNCMVADCCNRNFQSLAQRSKKGGKYNIGVEVIQTGNRGFGVRSNRTFEPNRIIVEYTGEIITQDECDRRMRTTYKKNECHYLMLFDQNLIIDATRGSIARFVNHSCEPNCRMEKWTVNGKPRMALFAGDKGIMTGDELTYDYNFDPFSQKNVQECRCGSSKCRGVLGPKAKEERKGKTTEVLRKSDTSSSVPDTVTNTIGGTARDNSTKTLAGAKRKIAAIIEEGTERWKKRPKLAVPASAVGAVKNVAAKSRTSANARTKGMILTAETGSTDYKGDVVVKGRNTSLVKKPLLRRDPSNVRRVSAASKRTASSMRSMDTASAATDIAGPSFRPASSSEALLAEGETEKEGELSKRKAKEKPTLKTQKPDSSRPGRKGSIRSVKDTAATGIRRAMKSVKGRKN